MTTAAICTIGDELLAGDLVDSNSAWLAAQLVELGIEVTTTVSIGDRLAALTTEVRRLVAGQDVVLCSGGLGPTSDDRTREAIAAATGTELVEQPALVERLEAFFAAHGVAMPRGNLRQAAVPEGATVLEPQGTAAGFALEVEGSLVVALPGPPWELQAMFTEALEPLLVALPGIRPAVTRVVRVSGLGESDCAQRLEPVEEELPADVDLAYLASGGELRVKLTARGEDRDAARARTDGPLARVVELLGHHVVTVDGGTLEETIVGRCREAGLTIAVAESASGGMVADRLASVPGASQVLLGGAVVYTAAAKQELAGVPAEVLQEHGLVSRTTTEALATGIRHRLGADLGVATTGVAGPDTMDGRPVGTLVWALADADGVTSWERVLPGDRRTVRRRLATAALEALRRRQ